MKHSLKILLFGSNGQIGTYLQQSLASVGQVICLSSKECNFLEPNKIEDSINLHKPNIIINAAAYTNVDKAESEPEIATAINVHAVEVMAKAAKDHGSLLIYYSSDYVFDGKKQTPYIESDKPNPLSVYGITKMQGEDEIRKSGCNHLIFRTSWVYSLNGKNFVSTIINLAKKNSSLSIINDQIGAPTSAQFVAESTAHCIMKGITQDKMGVYNLTAKDSVSWYEFAKYILSYLKNSDIDFIVDPANINAINSGEYNAAANRPKNSILSTELITKTFNLKINSWQKQLEPILYQIKLREMSKA